MTAPDLARWLKQNRADDAELRLPRTAVLALAEELSRLRQSSDRLRKQNGKMRRRIEKLKTGEPEPAED